MVNAVMKEARDISIANATVNTNIAAEVNNLLMRRHEDAEMDSPEIPPAEKKSASQSVKASAKITPVKVAQTKVTPTAKNMLKVTPAGTQIDDINPS